MMFLSSGQWLALVCVMGMSLGQVMFKVSALSLAESGSVFAQKTFILLTITMTVYVVVSFGWVLVLRKVQLGQAFPFYSLAFILVPIASYFLFGERFSNTYLVGILLIIVGLILCTRG